MTKSRLGVKSQVEADRAMSIKQENWGIYEKLFLVNPMKIPSTKKQIPNKYQ
jgi:hypothetical protein